MTKDSSAGTTPRLRGPSAPHPAETYGATCEPCLEDLQSAPSLSPPRPPCPSTREGVSPGPPLCLPGGPHASPFLGGREVRKKYPGSVCVRPKHDPIRKVGGPLETRLVYLSQ